MFARVLTGRGAGTGGSQDAGGTAVRKGCVSTSRPHGESMEEEDPGAFQVGTSTLWQILWLAFQVRHPRTTIYRSAMQQQLSVMNTTW